MTYLILRASGAVEPFTPKGKRPDLEEMQAIVSGLIERVRVEGGELWVNEEGLLIGLPLNDLATLCAKKPIVGDVLLCTRKKRQAH